MTGLTLASIILLVFGINLYFEANKVVGIIINLERVYNVEFQKGIDDFYRYIISGDDKHKENALKKLDSAYEMAYVFSKIESVLDEMPKEEWDPLLYNTYQKGLNYDADLSGFLGERVKLFLSTKDKKLNRCIEIAKERAIITDRIRNLIHAYQHNPNSEIDDFAAALDQMHLLFEEFAQVVKGFHQLVNQTLITSLIFLVVCLGMLSFFLSVKISRSITKPLAAMIENVKIIATGKLGAPALIDSRNEIGDLSRAFHSMQTSLCEVFDYSKKIASGNFQSKISPKSDEDILAVSLNEMAEKLERAQINHEEQNWLKNGQNELNAQMLGDLDVNELSEKVLSYLLRFLNVEIGAIYVYDPKSNYLQLAASNGLRIKDLEREIVVGDGIVGQVAKEMVPISLATSDTAYKIYSASGTINIQQILVVSFNFQ